MSLLERFPDSLRRMRRAALGSLIGALVAAIWLIEYWTGPELSVSILSVIPITLAVLSLGGAWVVIVPVVSAGGWLLAEFWAGQVYSHWEMGVWNALVRLGFFMIFVGLLKMTMRYLEERAARKAAEQVSRLKTNLMSLVSHEYANYLTNMKLALAVLHEPDSAQVLCSREDAYQILDSAITRLRVSTVTFLTMDRIEQGRLKLEMSRTAMREVALDAIALLQPIIEHNRLEILTEFPEQPVFVWADAPGLSIVISNLLTNAIKYTPVGGVIVVRITALGASWARFSIQDTGIGMSAEDIARVCSVPDRTEEGRERAKSSGLGLALINDLLELHGARLDIKSAPGQGTQFSFDLSVWDGKDGKAGR
ncbi:MAG: HAMP domain-containing sensor histidine kinase [Elusimicrobia bacterium]|nr:HAMP domain-containing sensor histidine kinase [Elusimicrobiota bacterium]